MKNNLKMTIMIISSLICIVGIIYSSIHIFTWLKDTHNNNKIKKEISKNINTNQDTIKINFNALKKQNPDTIAYLKVNGTNIDYIVVKGKDNSYYLKHNFYKEYNIAGWIFADYKNNFDQTDKNIIIYGHNTKDGSMFGTLTNVLDKKWSEKKDNQIITLITETKQLKYQVFSTYATIPEDYYIKTSFNNNEYQEFLKTITKRSIYNYNIEVSELDSILTLSSCIGDGEKRVVLHAVLINE